MTMQKSNRDFDKLKSHISGREFYLAQQIIGLTDGNKRHDPEHHQPCPRSSCDSDDDAFYVREDKGTFHCRKCDFSGNLIDLVMAVKGIDAIGAYDIIADYAGFRNASNSAIVKAAQQHPKNSRQYFQDGTVRKIEFVYTNEENNPRHKVVRLDGIAVSTANRIKSFHNRRWLTGDGRRAHQTCSIRTDCRNCYKPASMRYGLVKGRRLLMLCVRLCLPPELRTSPLPRHPVVRQMESSGTNLCNGTLPS